MDGGNFVDTITISTLDIDIRHDFSSLLGLCNCAQDIFVYLDLSLTLLKGHKIYSTLYHGQG